jgi:hypothetical protein
MDMTDLLGNMKYVSISAFSLFNNYSNLLPIKSVGGMKYSHNFSLCVQPLFDYNKGWEFIQWMEFHKLMGVSHFTFYNISIGPQVSCVMNSKAAQQGLQKTFSSIANF